MVSGKELIYQLNKNGVQNVIGEEPNSSNGEMSFEELIVHLISHEDARIRQSLISLVFKNPEISDSIPNAVNLLNGEIKQKLKIFYTAIFYLYNLKYKELKDISGNGSRIKDYFSRELGIKSSGDNHSKLKSVAEKMRENTGLHINWVGNFLHVANQSIARMKKEKMWEIV